MQHFYIFFLYIIFCVAGSENVSICMSNGILISLANAVSLSFMQFFG